MLVAWCRRVSSRSLRVNYYRWYTTAYTPEQQPPTTTDPVVLRPYQEQCIQSCLAALEEDTTRLGVSLPTGSGKTTVFISLLSRIQPPVHAPEAKRSLIVASSVEIAEQAVAQVKRLFPDWIVETEQGRKRSSGMADVTVGTYQSLCNRLHRFNPASFKAVIVDEAHHAASASYLRILSHFHQDIKDPKAGEHSSPSLHKVPIFGFSATLERHDGRALEFERVVYHRDFLEMVKENWLCDFRVTSVKADINLSGVAVSRGEFNASSLERVINTDSVNELVVRTWIDRVSQERKSTLIFCVTIAHVQALTKKFRGKGIDARYVYADTPAKERKAIIDAFKAGVFPVLINCTVLTEGTDIPNVDCVMLAKPTRSQGLFTQMIGRGMRLSPSTGKTDCRIIDFVDSQTRAGGVVSMPNLFGLKASDLAMDDETLESLERKAREIEDEKEALAKDAVPTVDPGPILNTVYYEELDGLRDSSKTDHQVRSLSNLAWVDCGDGIYVLEILGQGHYRIEPAQKNYDNPHGHSKAVYYVPANNVPSKPSSNPSRASKSKSPYFRRRLLRTSEHLRDLVQISEAHLNLALNFDRKVLAQWARWRKGPATDSQKAILRARWVKSGGVPSDVKEAKLNIMTKGDAADIITRLRHGLKGRLEKRRRA